jgi:hypothetical protein
VERHCLQHFLALASEIERRTADCPGCELRLASYGMENSLAQSRHVFERKMEPAPDPWHYRLQVRLLVPADAGKADTGAAGSEMRSREARDGEERAGEAGAGDAETPSAEGPEAAEQRPPEEPHRFRLDLWLRRTGTGGAAGKEGTVSREAAARLCCAPPTKDLVGPSAGPPLESGTALPLTGAGEIDPQALTEYVSALFGRMAAMIEDTPPGLSIPEAVGAKQSGTAPAADERRAENGRRDAGAPD